jgi:hypothetical protein
MTGRWILVLLIFTLFIASRGSKESIWAGEPPGSQRLNKTNAWFNPLKWFENSGQSACDWLDLGGDLMLWSVANIAHGPPDPGETDQRGLSRLRTQLRLDAKLNLPWNWRGEVSGHAFYDAAFLLRGRGEFTNQMLDKYEKEAEIEEAWLQGSVSQHVDLKTGRQIVVWGRADNLRVTDVLNPLDLRDPGLADLKDIRLPVTMTKVDWYRGGWDIAGIVVHEVRFTKYPAFGSDFFTSPFSLPHEEQPGLSLENQSLAFAVNRDFTSFDISLYGAYLFADRPHVEGFITDLALKHNRLYMLGAAGERTFGNWLFKAEIALFDNLKYSSLPDDTFSRLDMLVGIEYYGWSETMISLEVADYHILDFDPQLESNIESVHEDDLEWAFLFTRYFMHDRLNMAFLATIFDFIGSNGGFERLQFSYEWLKDVNLTLGVAFYQSGNRFPMAGIGNNDRIFAQIKYSF